MALYEILFVDGYSIFREYPVEAEVSWVLEQIATELINFDDVVRIYHHYGPNRKFRDLIAEF